MLGLKMIKFHLLLTVATLGQAAYYSRMATLNRLRAPTAFRPGVNLQRPWSNNHRLVQAASHRTPYVVYRGPSSQHRFAVKHYGPSTNRAVFSGGPWKTTSRLPVLSPAHSAPQYEYVKPASAQPLAPIDSGAIHTIPAPNLSLSEKPIVVVDSSDTFPTSHKIGQVQNQDHIYQMRINQPKSSYEVTEKYVEPVYQMAKIETPIGFSKPQAVPQPIPSSPDLQAYMRNGPGLQMASDYGLAAIAIPHRPVAPQPAVVPQPAQFQVQNVQSFNGIPTQQDLLSTGADSIMIPPNVLYQSDPLFLQKLQQQLLHRFPALEFVPYAAELVPQNPQTNNEAPQQQQIFLLENEELKQPPDQFLSSESKNVFQRETPERTLVTLLPQAFTVSNATEKVEPTTTQPPRNITLELVAAESQPVTTTIKYVIESNTEPEINKEREREESTEPQTAGTTVTQNTTPIYYAQIGQSVGNMIANGFFSAMNDVRAAAAMEQVVAADNIPTTTKAVENITTTTTTISPLNADLKQYFVQNNEISENKTVTELKPLLGVPFAKPADSVKVAYTLLRTEEKESKAIREGAVYAGQIVEASISEDHDFNNQKATLMKRAPIRLYTVGDPKDATVPTTSTTPKVTMVKAKIPPKSKLTFDDKTGEPVLRIYASYVDNPTQRQVVTTKLTSLRPTTTTRKATIQAMESWKASTVKSVDKTQGFDGNQVTQFGVKLRSRSDDYIPLFEEYDEI